jgi:hypothetical protein
MKVNILPSELKLAIIIHAIFEANYVSTDNTDIAISETEHNTETETDATMSETDNITDTNTEPTIELETETILT